MRGCLQSGWGIERALGELIRTAEWGPGEDEYDAYCRLLDTDPREVARRLLASIGETPRTVGLE